MRLDEIKRVAVLGAGTMGPGIALTYATYGYEVQIYDSGSSQIIEKAKSVIKTSLKTMVEAGFVQKDKTVDIPGLIKFTNSVNEAVRGAQFIVEAIVENKDAKRRLYEELDGTCSQDAIIASNTSFLNIYELMVPARLRQTIIAHWFAPPHIIPLVEVVKGDKTARETVDTTVELLKAIGKTPVLMEKFVPGFIINRIQLLLGKEIFFLLDNGYISAEQLDLAVKASLAPRMMVLGLVQRYDFTGLDLSARNLENGQYVEPLHDPRPRSLFDRVARGELGVKTGKGFYDYGDKKLEEILKERDINLLKVLHNTGFLHK